MVKLKDRPKSKNLEKMGRPRISPFQTAATPKAMMSGEVSHPSLEAMRKKLWKKKVMGERDAGVLSKMAGKHMMEDAAKRDRRNKSNPFNKIRSR